MKYRICHIGESDMKMTNCICTMVSNMKCNNFYIEIGTLYIYYGTMIPMNLNCQVQDKLSHDQSNMYSI